MIKYSKSANAFFSTTDSRPIPDDAIQIAQSAYAALLREVSAGKFLVSDQHGYPSISDTAPPKAKS